MDLLRTCRKRGVRLLAAGLQHQPLDILKRCGWVELLGDDHMFDTLALALDHALRTCATTSGEAA
jgi:hypothetical protein